MTPGAFKTAIETLLTEIIDGPPDPKWTWVVTNQPDGGLLTTVASLSAAQASAVPRGAGKSIAGHVFHVRFALRGAISWMKGVDPNSDWSKSFLDGPIDEPAWKDLQSSLHETAAEMRTLVRQGPPDLSRETVLGAIGTVAHAAYHLGAIRQLRLSV